MINAKQFRKVCANNETVHFIRFKTKRIIKSVKKRENFHI